MNEERKLKDDVIERPSVIGDNTMVRLGFLLGGLTVFGWAVWWASGVSSDLNTLKQQMIRFSQMDNIESRVKLLETVGSPQVRDLQKQFDELRRDFDLHKAATMVPTGK